MQLEQVDRCVSFDRPSERDDYAIAALKQVAQRSEVAADRAAVLHPHG